MAPFTIFLFSARVLAQTGDANVVPEPTATAPALTETAPTSSDSTSQPTSEVAPLEIPAPEAPHVVNGPKDLPAPAAPPSRLFADVIAYNGGLVIAQGTPEKPVRFESGAGQLFAQEIRLDTLAKTVEAKGTIRLERTTLQQRRELRPDSLPTRRRQEKVVETLVGENFHYDFKTQSGQMDAAKLRVANFNLDAASLQINGRRYTARDIVLRPGGLTDEERKIYGTPPFSLRAKSVTVVTVDPKKRAGRHKNRVIAQNAGLYFKNTRLLPVPSSVFRLGGAGTGRRRDSSAFQITPGISFNSADRVLVTTRFRFPVARDPERLALSADVGISQRIGFRGGASLDSQSRLGSVTLRARRSDIVLTQLTNRIELDREPQVSYASPALFAFNLPGGRRAGFSLGADYGRFNERTIGTTGGSSGAIRSNRLQGILSFTTRLNAVDGPYLELFASDSNYSSLPSDYRNAGFEVGYEGDFTRFVRGQVSYRSNSLRGATPFRFDAVEIARELRTTLDVRVTPRYIVPIDLRYDLSRHAFRDKTFGLLRSYKTFAYGLVYQQVRRDLRFEVRQGF